MTNEEAKQYLLSKENVMYREMLYERISAIIYRVDAKGNIFVSAELLDKSHKSVTVALIKDIKGV